MAWKVSVKESVLDDLRYFGRSTGRLILATAQERLAANPLEVCRHMKTMRPNRIAQRELRLFGKYRVLFRLDATEREVTIIIVGEKRGEALFVRGEEFTAHHESDSAD
jgi:mRNA-degrading endonuclease RelE of RelBE toxin-antitoxin system